MCGGHDPRRPPVRAPQLEGARGACLHYPLRWPPPEAEPDGTKAKPTMWFTRGCRMAPGGHTRHSLSSLTLRLCLGRGKGLWSPLDAVKPVFYR